MGYKLSIALGGLLLLSIAGSAWYIDYLHDQIAQLRANSIVLKTEIDQQNKDIEKLLSSAANTQKTINDLELAKNASEREVNKLRDTFAKHDLDNLALAKPGLIQNRVNKATLRVKDNLINITDPNQFDDNEEDNTNN